MLDGRCIQKCLSNICLLTLEFGIDWPQSKLKIAQRQIARCEPVREKSLYLSFICHAPVPVGTRLHQKLDNLKVPILGCNVKRCHSIICCALVFVGTPSPPELGQLQSALPELQCKEVSFHHLSCLGLCLHLTPPELGQLQSALPELQ